MEKFIRKQQQYLYKFIDVNKDNFFEGRRKVLVTNCIPCNPATSPSILKIKSTSNTINV